MDWKLELLRILGFILIWIAVHIGRKEDSRIKIISWQFLVQVLLIGLGASILQQ